MGKTLLTLCAAVSVLVLGACTDDDSFSTSPSNVLTFSTDTVRFDTLFATVPSSTRTFGYITGRATASVVPLSALQAEIKWGSG